MCNSIGICIINFQIIRNDVNTVVNGLTKTRL